jgi:hypothetical protein
MKLVEDSPDLKSFTDVSSQSANKINKNLTPTSILFARKINLTKNDYFSDFGLKKNNKNIGSFLSSNDETNPSLNSQKRMHSDIYERLKNEDEQFIKTLLKLKEKMNNNNSIIVHPENRNLSSKDIYKKRQFPSEIPPYEGNNNINRKPIKVFTKRKISLYDNGNKSNNISYNLNKSSNSSNRFVTTHRKSNTKEIINSKPIFKTKKKIDKKNSFKKNNQNNTVYIIKNIDYISNRNLTKPQIKNINVEKKKPKDKNNNIKEIETKKKNVPIAVIDLFDESPKEQHKVNIKKNSFKLKQVV